MEEQTMGRVRALLAEAGNAHHDFEENELKGGKDQDWPAWYAGYCLTHGLHDLIGREMGEDELAKLLQTCDEDYRRDQIQEEWPDYYARQIVKAG